MITTTRHWPNQMVSDGRGPDSIWPAPRLRILVHDYAGHPFQVQLSRELARRGHDVLHTFAGSLQTPRGALARVEDDPATFDIHETPMDPQYARHKYSFVRRRGMEIRYGRSVAELVREWKPELVLSANTPSEAQASILNAAQHVGARFVYWLQDIYSLAVDKLVRRRIPVVGSWIGGYYRWLDRRHFRFSDSIVVITDDFAPLLTGEFGVAADRIATIPNWAPLESLPVLDKVNRWSQEFDLADKFVFLYTGTLGMKHNPALLLHLAEACRDDSKVRVVVVSEGIGVDWLREAGKKAGLNNILLLPFQPFDVMSEVLATGDTLISVLEEDAGIFSVPSKVLTYLCARRPLLLSVPEVNLAARIVRDENAGLVVAPNETAGFLEAALQLRNDQSLRDSRGTNAREYAERTFRVEEVAGKFESVFNGPRAVGPSISAAS